MSFSDLNFAILLILGEKTDVNLRVIPTSRGALPVFHLVVDYPSTIQNEESIYKVK